jgi:hypothetical protein
LPLLRQEQFLSLPLQQHSLPFPQQLRFSSFFLIIFTKENVKIRRTTKTK